MNRKEFDVKLSEWMKLVETKGYSEEQLRLYLRSQGYPEKDVNKAVNLINARPKQKIDLKTILKPNPLKIFFPALFFVLIMVGFFVNIVYIPKFGSSIIDFESMVGERASNIIYLRDYSSQENADPKIVLDYLKSGQEFVDEVTNEKAEFIHKIKPIALANTYFLYSSVYVLDPFFPLPCELISFAPLYPTNGLVDVKSPLANHCHSYASKEFYDLLERMLKPTGSLSSNTVSGAGLLSIMYPIEYRKASFLVLFLHSIILAIEIYLVACILHFISIKLSPKPIYKILLIMLILLAGFLISDRHEYEFVIILLLSLGVPFAISLFIPAQRRLRAQYIFIISLIVLLATGLIYMNIILDKAITSAYSDSDEYRTSNVTQEGIIYCNSTKELNETDKLEYLSNREQLFINETWNVCLEPECDQLIAELTPDFACSEVTLRGENPSCVYFCRQRIRWPIKI